MCKHELEHGSVYPAAENEEITTQEIQNKSKITIYNFRNNFKILLPIECTLAIVVFGISHLFEILLNSKHDGKDSMRSDGQSNATSSRLLPGYYVVLIITSVLWFGMAVASMFSIGQSGTEPSASMAYLCDFQASILTRTHMHPKSVADPGFSRGGGVNPPGGVNTPNFPENCMKSKEFGLPGGACVPHAPPRSANALDNRNIK